MSAFLTTVPPLPNVIDYSIRGSYMLLFGAWSATLAVIVTGSAILYGVSEMKRDWLVTVRVKSARSSADR